MRVVKWKLKYKDLRYSIIVGTFTVALLSIKAWDTPLQLSIIGDAEIINAIFQITIPTIWGIIVFYLVRFYEWQQNGSIGRFNPIKRTK